jgi:hypothetical protein
MASSTKTKLDELLDELTDADLDFEGFAQKHYERVSDLSNRLAKELLSQGLIHDPRESDDQKEAGR